MRASAAAALLLLAGIAHGAADAATLPPCDAQMAAQGKPVRWEAVAAPGATNGAAYTETTRQTNRDRYPLCAFAAPVAPDVDVAVRFLPTGGRLDRVAGIAVRLRDAETYYVLRADVIEGNVRLYRVLRGHFVQIGARERVPIAPNAWHVLRLRAQGERFAAWLDDVPMLEARDWRIADAGRVALWSHADSQTLFEPPRVDVLPKVSP